MANSRPCAIGAIQDPWLRNSTLELGDPPRKTVLFFLNGWLDMSVLYAVGQPVRPFLRRGGRFRLRGTEHEDYDPEIEPADESKLGWPLQADILHEVVMDMGLKDTTLVLHDFGSIVGCTSQGILISSVGTFHSEPARSAQPSLGGKFSLPSLLPARCHHLLPGEERHEDEQQAGSRPSGVLPKELASTDGRK